MICKIFILRNQNTSRSLSLEHVLLCPVAKHTITLVDQVSEQEFFSDSQIGEVSMYSHIRHVICQKIYNAGFSGQKFYTVKCIICDIFHLQLNSINVFNISNLGIFVQFNSFRGNSTKK